METYGERRYWIEVIGQLYAPAAFSSGKETPVRNEQESGWALQPVRTLWRGQKKAPIWIWNRTPAVQPTLG